MLRTLTSLAIAFTLSLSAIAADYGHIHLTTTDSEAAAHWYAKHFGGKPTGFGGATGEGVKIDRAMISGIGVIMFEKKPGFEGSVGTAVDHIGFSMEDIPAKAEALVADGATMIGKPINMGGMDIAFITDPWGTKIELIDDPETRGVHHIHLHTPNVEETLDWYEAAFGGERTKFKNLLPSLKYGQVWLIAQKSNKELAPTKGRAMDHLGWNFPDLDEAAEDLKAKGVNFTLDPRPYKNIKIAFVDGPDGVRIELVEPPKE